MFDRIEAFSETGFRGKSDCIEERLLVANLLLDETAEANMPLAIINLDLSKAFDKVKWDALWKLWLLRVFPIICFGFSPCITTNLEQNSPKWLVFKLPFPNGSKQFVFTVSFQNPDCPTSGGTDVAMFAFCYIKIVFTLKFGDKPPQQ